MRATVALTTHDPFPLLCKGLSRWSRDLLTLIGFSIRRYGLGTNEYNPDINSQLAHSKDSLALAEPASPLSTSTKLNDVCGSFFQLPANYTTHRITLSWSFDMSSACQRALGIVEIVRIVVYYIDTRQALARCARVSRLWHDEALPPLWRGSNLPSEIGSIAFPYQIASEWGPTWDVIFRLINDPKTAKSLPKYLGFIRLLNVRFDDTTVHGPRWPHKALFDWTIWKNAAYQYLSVRVFNSTSTEIIGTNLSTLLHRWLLILELHGVEYDAEFLEDLEVFRPVCGSRFLLTHLTGHLPNTEMVIDQWSPER